MTTRARPLLDGLNRSIQEAVVKLLCSIGTLESHSDSIMSVAFSPTGQLLASGSRNNTVCLWDIATSILTNSLDVVPTFYFITVAVTSVAASPDTILLASSSSDGRIYPRDLTTGALV